MLTSTTERTRKAVKACHSNRVKYNLSQILRHLDFTQLLSSKMHMLSVQVSQRPRQKDFSRFRAFFFLTQSFKTNKLFLVCIVPSPETLNISAFLLLSLKSQNKTNKPPHQAMQVKNYLIFPSHQGGLGRLPPSAHSREVNRSFRHGPFHQFPTTMPSNTQTLRIRNRHKIC